MELQALSSGRINYGHLLTEQETAIRLLRSTEENLTQMGVYEAMQLGNAKVLETAQTATLVPRASPTAIPFSFLVSLLSAIVLAVILETIDTRLRSPYQERRFLNLPTLGAILAVENKQPLIADLSFNDPLCEAYNKAAFQIQSAAIRQKASALLVTSSLPGEGKSVICTNLGIAFSRLGERVLILDTDFRKPTLHHLFGFPSLSPGLSEYLTGELDPELENAVEHLPRPTSTTGLFMIPSGRLVPNPAGLLRSAMLKELLNSLLQRFDFLLLTGRPFFGKMRI